PIPTLTDTITGLVNGDTAAVLTGFPLSTTATSASAPGSYPITVGGGSAANYTVALAGGTLTLTSPTLVGLPQVAVGAGAGGSPPVTVYNSDGSTAYSVVPFPGFTGGVRVAMGDFLGTGVPDLVVGSGPGMTAQVEVFNGDTGQQLFSVQPFSTF